MYTVTLMNRLMSFIGLADEEIDETPSFAPAKSKGNNVVSLHTHKNIRLILFEPHLFDDTQEIADNLKGHRPVLVNLKSLDQEQGSKVIDFLSGTVYALGGSIRKVGVHIFVCAPPNVDIQGSISEVFHE